MLSLRDSFLQLRVDTANDAEILLLAAKIFFDTAFRGIDRPEDLDLDIVGTLRLMEELELAFPTLERTVNETLVLQQNNGFDSGTRYTKTIAALQHIIHGKCRLIVYEQISRCTPLTLDVETLDGETVINCQNAKVGVIRIREATLLELRRIQAAAAVFMAFYKGDL